MQNSYWKNVVLRQFLAAIRMLENSIRAAPPDVWAKPGQPIEWHETEPVGFWYVAFHTVFFLDYFLSDSPASFSSPEPDYMCELDPAGVLPARVYTKEELLSYLSHCEAKLVSFVDRISDDRAQDPCGFPGLGLTIGELLLNGCRHVQHHAAQLNLLLRQHTGAAPRWVFSIEPKDPA